MYSSVCGSEDLKSPVRNEDGALWSSLPSGSGNFLSRPVSKFVAYCVSYKGGMEEFLTSTGVPEYNGSFTARVFVVETAGTGFGAFVALVLLE